jgi:hypothetical protein
MNLLALPIMVMLCPHQMLRIAPDCLDDVREKMTFDCAFCGVLKLKDDRRLRS